MPESVEHYNMIDSIKQWIINNFDNSENFSIYTDSPNSIQPIRLDGFIPDVYATSFSKDKQIIIGEAKTARDLDSKHSEKQILSFLKHCSNNKNSLFILAVPWDLVRYARSILNDLKIKCQAKSVRTIIIEDFSN